MTTKIPFTKSYVSFVRNRFFAVAKKVQLEVIFDMIKGGSNKKNVDLYKVSKEHKYKLDSPTFCVAKFSNDYAKNEYLKETSFLIFDFDNLNNQTEVFKGRFEQSPNTLATFKSFSGNGLYVLYALKEPIKTAEHYAQNYKHYAKRIYKDYGIKADKQTKDVRRLITIPYDKHIYINYNAVPIEVIDFVEPEAELDTEQGKLDLNEVSKWFPDGVIGYADWFNLALGLAPYGDKGRDLFVEISQRGDYKDNVYQIESKFDNIVKTTTVRSDEILKKIGEKYYGKNGD